MSTSELKKKLISRILESKNPDLLKEVYRLLEIENEDIEIYKLSSEQKKGLDEAKKEIDSGKGISHEKVIRKFRKNLLMPK